MTTLKNKHGHNNDLYNDVEKIKEAHADTTKDIKDKVSDILLESIEGVKDKTADVKNNVENYTAEKPLKSLGIALLVGAALGYFLHK